MNEVMYLGLGLVELMTRVKRLEVENMDLKTQRDELQKQLDALKVPPAKPEEKE